MGVVIAVVGVVTFALAPGLAGADSAQAAQKCNKTDKKCYVVVQGAKGSVYQPDYATCHAKGRWWREHNGPAGSPKTRHFWTYTCTATGIHGLYSLKVFFWGYPDAYYVGAGNGR